ncbi:MAG: ribulose-phosphate 3-epimerase [Synergistaceae bacterium]|nr:ribulose-phosphate 3-epimerase [Synergistaceae bacterium]
MTRDILLAPSILGADPLSVSAAVDSILGHFDWLHVDVMDGHFVRNLSFGPATVKALRERYPDVFLDVHLMLDELDVLLPIFVSSGASQVTIHAEVEPQLLHHRLSSIKEKGLKAGVAIAPLTPVEHVRLALPVVDVVLLLSVTPGFGGQSLIVDTLEKARDLVRLRAAEGHDYLIEIDGGVKLDNAAQVAAAGCDVLVMGSAVFGSPAPADYLKKTRNCLKEVLV